MIGGALSRGVGRVGWTEARRVFRVERIEMGERRGRIEGELSWEGKGS